MTWLWFHKLASPPHFYRIAGRWLPWLGWSAAVLGVTGLVWGLVLAPSDYQQGEGYRILYVHAPSAWLSTFTYTTMAVSAAVGLVWRMNVAHSVSASCAPLGASFTFVALATGSLWGKPMWGTWWEWDPRLTSELLLLFLYLGYMGLRSAIEDQTRADRVCALLAIVGVVNVPIIYYSVEWWNSLHQAPSVMKFGKPTMPASMLVPLLMMFAAGTLFAATMVLMRARGEILRRERVGTWLEAAVGESVALTGEKR
jgi:heme exporter protein C